MATYKQIEEYIKNKHGFVVKGCWIAHMKEICGLPVKIAHNRQSITERKVPCPPEKMKIIKDTFRYFEMI